MTLMNHLWRKPFNKMWADDYSTIPSFRSTTRILYLNHLSKHKRKSWNMTTQNDLLKAHTSSVNVHSLARHSTFQRPTTTTINPPTPSLLATTTKTLISSVSLFGRLPNKLKSRKREFLIQWMEGKGSLSYESIGRKTAKDEPTAHSAASRKKRRKQANRGNSDSNMLWSEKYRPKKFMDLLGDQVRVDG